VSACDNTGVMLIQPSGDGEGSFDAANLGNPPIKAAVKQEVWRDGIVRDRNNPSILAWEACNATIDPTFVDGLRAMKNVWDSLTPRKISVRGGPEFAPGDLVGCTLTGCEVGRKSANPLMPAWGSEAWGRQSARFEYDFEIAFIAEFLQNWRKSQQGNCFGLCQWYLAETPGEVGNFLEMQAGVEANDPRSFGSSMTDFNRIPKMLYYAYKAAWRPYSLEPVVAIAHHWNRSGAVAVNVFSNCPGVRLLINGTSQGTKIPNPWTGAGTNNDLTETTTQLPFECTWNVTWAAGTLRAEGLDANGNMVCFDEKKTAGAADHIVLTVDPHVVKPSGEVFDFRANGTDAALILATVVDANGVRCPLDSHNVTFSVSGPGNYRGGSDQFVTPTQPLGYHAPLDPELRAEGGMCKVAVRTTFTPGVVTVSATAPGLAGAASTSFAVLALDAPVSIGGPALHGAASSMVTARFAEFGRTIRYFLSGPASVTIEILTANGRIVRRVANDMLAQGWHTLPLETTPALAAGNGVYVVRLAVAGGSQFVKRFVCMR
jgi:hypothetical protein